MTSEQLSKELDLVRNELNILYEISNAMRTTLELNHILYIILTGVTADSGLGFNRAILFLVNEEKQYLEPKMAIGPESLEDARLIWKHITESNPDLEDLITKEKIDHTMKKAKLFQSIKELQIPLDSPNENVLANAYHLGAPMHIPKDRIEEFSKSALLQIIKTEEIVIMPLKAKDKVIGLIVADNHFTQKPISQRDLKTFMMLANQAGLAIENSQLYELVIEKSHTDTLTGLWNHGFFQNQLTQQLKITKLEEQTLSLIMIDIDNFKIINDTYGHQSGDFILKQIANILKDSSREIDYACRYGGEELAIILTKTDKEQGSIIAERIRKRIEDHSFKNLKSNDHLKITVSIGLASFPNDSSCSEDLIAKADKAMYEAKFSGKNLVRLSTEH
jgi:diguanylate cyclase (GGDEF)-like protein